MKICQSPEENHTSGGSEDTSIEHNHHVLLVEDKPVNQKVASRFLSKLNLDVEVAENGQEAVTKVQSSQYDIIFMDMRMPVMDGLEAIKLIRKMETEKVIDTENVIVSLTANAYDLDGAACCAAGAIDFLSKPIDRPKLKATVEKWISLKSEANS